MMGENSLFPEWSPGGVSIQGEGDWEQHVTKLQSQCLSIHSHRFIKQRAVTSFFLNHIHFLLLNKYKNWCHTHGLFALFSDSLPYCYAVTQHPNPVVNCTCLWVVIRTKGRDGMNKTLAERGFNQHTYSAFLFISFTVWCAIVIRDLI